MSRNSETLVNRRNAKPDEDAGPNCYVGQSLTLMEKVFLIALKDGKIPIWNDNLSATLRGCALVELALLDRVALQPRTERVKGFNARKVELLSDKVTGERILDETLKHIKVSPEKSSVALWIECLNGENWNPWNWRYQLKFVKDRLAKDLVEKGVLIANKVDYLFFDMIIYPLRDEIVRRNIIEEVQAVLLHRWPGSVDRIDQRTLSLVFLLYSADLFDEILNDLRVPEHNLAKSRLHSLLEINFEKESEKNVVNDMIWAVASYLLN